MLNQWNGSDLPTGPSLFDFRNRVGRLLRDVWAWNDVAGSPYSELTGGPWAPAIDLIEDAEHYRLYVELPGVDPEHVNIQIENTTLTIHGEKPEVTGTERRLHRCERAFGVFERTFALPPTVETDTIDASYANGVLTISLAKAEPARARQIPVTTS